MFNLSIGQDKFVLLGKSGVSPGDGLKAGFEPAELLWLFSPGHREDGTGGKHMAFLLLFVNLDCEFLVIKLFIYFSGHEILITIAENITHQDGYILGT